MAEKGWIKVDKGLVERWRGTQKLMWWIDLLMMATIDEKVVSTGGKTIKLTKGQIAASVRSLSSRWLVGERSVRTFIAELERLQLIERSVVDKVVGIIRLKNDTPTDTPTDTHNKEGKKEKKKEKDINKFISKKKVFSPPEQKEVEAYFIEVKSSCDEAAKFFDHFTSNGWKVSGRTAMKDWKAAARNWIRNAPKYANRYYHTTSASHQDAKREFAETAMRVTERFMRGEG